MYSLPLDPDLSIETCAALKQRLDADLEQPTLLLLDGSAIERVHTASLQLLCALFRTRQHAGLDTGWIAASPVLREAARLLGLSAALALTDHEQLFSNPQLQPQPQDIEIAA